MRRFAVVINSAAGGLLGRRHAAAMVSATLDAAGIRADILGEEAGASLDSRLDQAIASGAEVVVVGGGDGTICAAAQRLAGSGIALGILPLGTMNMLAKDLRIPLDLEAAAANLAQGRPRAIDVASVNGQVFLCNSVLGLPTALGRQRERHRGDRSVLGGLRLLREAWRASWHHPPLRLGIAIDGTPPMRFRSRAIAIANNAYAEGFGQLFTRQRLDQGELVLYVARGFGVWWSIVMVVAMALGAWRRRSQLHERRAEEIVLHSRRKRLRVMNDGEAMILRPPLTYRIQAQALSVIVPQD